MKARFYEDTDRSGWNALVRDGRLGHFMLDRGFMEYHADRFEDASIVVFDGSDRLIAALPATRHDDRLVSHGGLTFGGLQISGSIGARKTLEIFRTLISFARDNGFASLRYKSAPHIYQVVPGDEDLYALFRAGAVLERRDVASSIALDAPPLARSKGRRASVTAAGRVVDVVESEDFAAFVEIENEALERHGVRAVHSADELKLLHERFPTGVRLFLGVEDGQPVAGVVVFDTPTTRHTQYIGATQRGKTIGASDAILDHLITDARGRFRWFDFGISTERDGHVLNEGLAAYKESFGARAVNYDHYELALTDEALTGLSQGG